MAISRERKEKLVAQYVELLDTSKAIFVTEYTGLGVKALEALRAEVRKADGSFFVTKNTLLKNALEKTGKPVPAEILVGQVATGFAFNEAPSLAKTLTDFAQKEERLIIRGGLLGNETLTAEQVEALAKLPSLNELRSQIIGLLQAPAQNITSAVANGVRQLINVVDAYAKQEDDSREAAEAAA